jgi:hypothetical protein
LIDHRPRRPSKTQSTGVKIHSFPARDRQIIIISVAVVSTMLAARFAFGTRIIDGPNGWQQLIWSRFDLVQFAKL